MHEPPRALWRARCPDSAVRLGPRAGLAAVLSAPAAMVAAGWHDMANRGGAAVGGDMVVHAAAAQWLETLPWWDWRGWSDWFYGGQALGVNYPPLGHAWLRLTHPFYGQMVAVSTGLLVLLPWGAWRLARAVQLPRRGVHVAVISTLVLVSASGGMHWVLSGFHTHSTFFGSWPAMLAIVCGLFVAAWAAGCSAPVACGAVIGLVGLLNASYLPGTVVVSAALLVTSGAPLRQVSRWAMTAGVTAAAVCGWWLVPFLAGWGRVVGSENSLGDVWRFGGRWQEVVLVAFGLAAVWGGCRSHAARRLALAAGAGLAAAWVADLGGYERAERFLDLPILVAAAAAAGLVAGRTEGGSMPGVRPVWALGIAVFLVLFALSIDQHEILPLAAWPVLWRPGRDWVWGLALAWFSVLSWIPLWAQLRDPPSPEPVPGTVVDGTMSLSGPDADGSVYLGGCEWTNAWRTTAETGGRIRVLGGLYDETSTTAEFIGAAGAMAVGNIRYSAVTRPHWDAAWQATNSEALTGSSPAYALGARWRGMCSDEGDFTMHELPAVPADGVQIALYPDEDSWHKAAVDWWVGLASRDWQDSMPELTRIPVLWPDHEVEGEAALADRAARGVSLHTEQDRLFVMAESAGWAWLRVPWDPWWFGSDGVPLKGGPGHLVVWVEPGVTELRWDVPAEVDAMAAAVTALSLLLLVVMVRVNRREGWETDPDRPRPAADTLNRLADEAERRMAALSRAMPARVRPAPTRVPSDPAGKHQDVESAAMERGR